jgi:hypothetical protein
MMQEGWSGLKPPCDCDGSGSCGCGCGGDCGNETSLRKNVGLPSSNFPALTGESIAQMRAMASDLRANIGEDAWMKKILRTLPGESTTHTAATPAGDHYTATAAVDVARNIRVRVHSTRENATLVDAQLIWIGSGWSASNNTKQSNTIPPSTSLDLIALAALATVLGNPKRSGKVVDKYDPCATEANYHPPDAGTYCVPHDLKCTSPLGSNQLPIFTSDKTHVIFVAPCIGSYSVDIGNCCFDHDIGIWCAKNLADVSGANLKVSSCVIGNIIAQAWNTLWEESKSVPWYLRPFELLICAALISTWQASLIAELPILFGIFNLAYDLLLFNWLKSNPCYADFDGRHADSCLCGGTVPTSQCAGVGDYGACTDLCKLTKTTGIEQCHRCGYTCEYVNGIPKSEFDSGTDRVTNPNGWPCCPGTSLSCTTTPPPPCPPCAECEWGCDCDKKTHKWVPGFDMWIKGSGLAVDRSSGIKCCNGLNPYDPPPMPWLDCEANNGHIPC